MMATTVRIGSIAVDFYLSESEDVSSGLALVDSENYYLICLYGFFTKDELIEIAESLVKTEIPKP